MVATVIPVDPFDLVIFGGTGDLARRKILPALYRRLRAGQMPKNAHVVGVGRKVLPTEAYRQIAASAIREFVRREEQDAGSLDDFLRCLTYRNVDVRGREGWSELRELMCTDHVRVFYFSVAPSLFSILSERTHDEDLATPDCRIVVEKPFGHDFASARTLNTEMAATFDEHQIYRIDHYLGKETVQNLMALRFGNALFEPVWNSQFVDNVQITVAESIGIGDRGGYYDEAGAMRDMVQNHLMQLLCLTAMEPPAQFDPDAIRDEKLKVIKSLGPVMRKDVVRGQYLKGNGGSGYLEECGNPKSRTETFVALKVQVDNWRWSGTPFYLRTGKRLRSTLTEVSVAFKDPRHWIFDEHGNRKGTNLAIRLQPNEGITMRMTIKDPGPGGMRLKEVPLDMSFADALDEGTLTMPDAYERLIMDVVRGNQTLFMRGDEVEAAWSWVDPIILRWSQDGSVIHEYEPGTVGPIESLFLLHRDSRYWREI
ncbi:MAG: glucose-6-phosphate dehydrogenase [Paracoccaceae bacterium]|nr:glucose-6-phosphate dehydrogenase [Paracoccaceae bacterium]MDE2914875.1 glucose-6-phosphate dehydrogenase [Paracoccaceae bacterium]